MKNKKNLYFLVPAVLFVWGVIIYRVVDFTSDGDADFTPRTYATPLRENQETEQYQLKSSYPDPFLKTLTSADGVTSLNDKIDNQEQPQTQETTTPITPLNIQYRGFITESGTNARIALLVIEGKEVFLKKGEQLDAFVIKQIQSDSISIAIADGVRWVRREE